MRKTKDAKTMRRFQIILNLADGRSPTETAKAVGATRSTVYRVAKRFCEHREAGLVDRREDNGENKLTTEFLATLNKLVADSPQNHGWKRPTWTRELLTKTMRTLTGTQIHVDTMSRALQQVGARLGRAKPIVGCPWAKARKTRRLNEIQKLIDELPDDEVAVYEDEVDIHLNPKIGADWMVRGQQKQVMTPGKNVKHYVAGAINVKTGELTWVASEKKNSMLFVLILWELTQRYSDARTIHVILDNYGIHSSRQVEVSLDTQEGQRLNLIFLPPYCPDHNPIERLWRDLHSNVTRNHNCEDIKTLMKNVNRWLKQRTKENINNYLTI